MLDAAPVLQLLGLQGVVLRLKLQHLLALFEEVHVRVAERALQLADLALLHPQLPPQLV